MKPTENTGQEPAGPITAPAEFEFEPVRKREPIASRTGAAKFGAAADIDRAVFAAEYIRSGSAAAAWKASGGETVSAGWRGKAGAFLQRRELRDLISRERSSRKHRDGLRVRRDLDRLTDRASALLALVETVLGLDPGQEIPKAGTGTGKENDLTRGTALKQAAPLVRELRGCLETAGRISGLIAPPSVSILTADAAAWIAPVLFNVISDRCGEETAREILAEVAAILRRSAPARTAQGANNAIILQDRA